MQQKPVKTMILVPAVVLVACAIYLSWAAWPKYLSDEGLELVDSDPGAGMEQRYFREYRVSPAVTADEWHDRLVADGYARLEPELFPHKYTIHAWYWPFRHRRDLWIFDDGAQLREIIKIEWRWY